MKEEYKIKVIGTSKTVNNFVDMDTGEVLDTDEQVKHDSIVFDSKERFMFTYTAIIGAIEDLPKGATRLLAWCALNAEFNTNLIVLNRVFKKRITDDIGMPEQTIRNNIARLKEFGALIPEGSATYRIHPKYYWRGERSARSKTLRYVLDLSIKGH